MEKHYTSHLWASWCSFLEQVSRLMGTWECELSGIYSCCASQLFNVPSIISLSKCMGMTPPSHVTSASAYDNMCTVFSIGFCLYKQHACLSYHCTVLVRLWRGILCLFHQWSPGWPITPSVWCAMRITDYLLMSGRMWGWTYDFFFSSTLSLQMIPKPPLSPFNMCTCNCTIHIGLCHLFW